MYRRISVKHERKEVTLVATRLPEAIEPLMLKYFLYYDRLCKLEMGFQNFDWLKVNTVQPRLGIFHDGKAVIHKVKFMMNGFV